MKTIPGMTVIAPCDALEAMKALEAAVQLESPVYIRLYGGTATPIVYHEDFDFKVGKSVTLAKGEWIADHSYRKYGVYGYAGS